MHADPIRGVWIRRRLGAAEISLKFIGSSLVSLRFLAQTAFLKCIRLQQGQVSILQLAL